MNLYSQFKKATQQYGNNSAIRCCDRQYSYLDTLSIIDSMKLYWSSSHRYGVVICLPKNEYCIFAQLSVNGAGHVFIPLDVRTPYTRLCTIIKKTNPRYLMLENTISAPEMYRIIVKNSKYTIWEQDENRCTIYDECITHIYFSSGSTGEPKGILLNDEPIIEVVLEQAATVGINQTSRFAWLLSPSFDASLSDIYMTLLSGAELHICTFEQNKIKTLIQFFNDKKISHSDISPSVLSLLNCDDFLTVEAIIFGGEVGNEWVIKKWANYFKMYNAYGPTETTICTSLKKVDASWTMDNIGQPLKNVKYHIEDGELIIQGHHVGFGYLDTQLTHHKFFNQDAVRCYRSGDLVRMDSVSGDYIFMGRKDRQFKYNGILICPEEIEKASLSAGCCEAHCQLEDKVTLYVTGNIDKNRLRDALAKLLPSFMIPQVIILKKSLAKNINGKIQL